MQSNVACSILQPVQVSLFIPGADDKSVHTVSVSGKFLGSTLLEIACFVLMSLADEKL